MLVEELVDIEENYDEFVDEESLEESSEENVDEEEFEDLTEYEGQAASPYR